MSEAARAVGSTRSAGKVRPMKPDMGDVWDAIARMEDKIDGMSDTIGKPGTPDNGVAASGMFAHLNAHDMRLKQFEKLWERAKGFAIGATPLLAAIWFLVGDKVGKLFH